MPNLRWLLSDDGMILSLDSKHIYTIAQLHDDSFEVIGNNFKSEHLIECLQFCEADYAKYLLQTSSRDDE